ncbi:MAG: hypothetical protein HQL06_04135 [Nitrospirae bacterium]|nr:hypothetical protein [Nitrospirota bacterium]
MSRKLKQVRVVMIVLFMLFTKLVSAQIASPDDDPVIARIGDTVITMSQFKNQIKHLENVKDRLVIQRRYDVLDRMVTDILFSKEAIEKGLDKELAVTVIKNNPDAQQVEFLSKVYKTKYLGPPKISDQEAAEYYQSNLNKYNVPKVYGGLMVSISNKNIHGDDCTDKCKEAAQEIYTRLSNKDYETFAKLNEEVTKKYPDISVAFVPLSHWDGKFKEGTPYDKTLSEFTQLVKDQAKIVQEKDAIVVINLLSIYEPAVYKFEEVKNRVIADIERFKQQQIYNDTVKELAEKYKLQIYNMYVKQAVGVQTSKSEGKPSE